MPKRSLKELKDFNTAGDSQAHDESISESLWRLEQGLLPRPKSTKAAESSSVESTDDSSLNDMKGSFPSIIISPDATPIFSAIDENDCSNHAIIEAGSKHEIVPTTALDHQSQVTLVIEKAPLHVAPRLHKERPDRIEWIRESLRNKGLLDKCHVLKDKTDSRTYDELDNGSTGRRNLKRQRITTCQENVLKSVQKIHSAGYIKRMEKLEEFSGCLKEEAHQYDSVYLTQHSWNSAIQSTASLCKLVDHILSSVVDNPSRSTTKRRPIPSGFACIRPPGHHASSSLANGYCLINHIAVAAKYALDYHGCEAERTDGRAEPDERERLASQQLPKPFQNPSVPQRRVAILDWDVHHGDGTQSIFWNDPNVLFCSIHAQKAFPFAAGSSAKSIGGPQALGKTVNVAWTSHGMGDKEYLYVLQTLILPILQEFHPTLLLISAGFDAAAGDGYGGNLSPANGFGRLTTEILKVANHMECPVVASLEGGYKRSVLGPCVTSVVQSMIDFGQETNNESGERIAHACSDENLVSHYDSMSAKNISVDDVCPTAVKNVESTRQAQQKYWKCLSSSHPLPQNGDKDHAS